MKDVLGVMAFCIGGLMTRNRIGWPTIQNPHTVIRKIGQLERFEVTMTG